MSGECGAHGVSYFFLASSSRGAGRCTLPIAKVERFVQDGDIHSLCHLAHTQLTRVFCLLPAHDSRWNSLLARLTKTADASDLRSPRLRLARQTSIFCDSRLEETENALVSINIMSVVALCVLYAYWVKPAGRKDTRYSRKVGTPQNGILSRLVQ